MPACSPGARMLGTTSPRALESAFVRTRGGIFNPSSHPRTEAPRVSETTPSIAPSAGDDGPDAAHNPGSLDFPVVGIGASAGGVQALLRFFENAPSDMGMAFVVVLHLSAKHVSSADKVLQNVTRMSVLQVSGPTRIEPNHVYVIAPGTSLTMADGFLNARNAEPTTGRPVTIDQIGRAHV